MSTFLTEDITSGRNWRALERAVARIMLHLGWHDVTVIGGAGDQGGDVLGTKYEPQIGVERSWVVQCKAVTGSNYVGKAAVDEAIHGLSKYDASIAAVATNGEFTKRAFMNGKISIDQAEGISDLVSAESEKQAQSSSALLTGKLKEKVVNK